MVKEEDATQEACLVEREALLNAREKDISSQEGKLEATLRSKDEELEGRVQRHTKELEDKHKAALDALTANSATQVKKLADDLAAASTAKTDLEQQVAKLTEELAGSAKEVEVLKEEARQAELHLANVQSQLSSKTQSLETANDNNSDMKERIGSLE